MSRNSGGTPFQKATPSKTGAKAPVIGANRASAPKPTGSKAPTTAPKPTATKPTTTTTAKAPTGGVPPKAQKVLGIGGAATKGTGISSAPPKAMKVLGMNQPKPQQTREEKNKVVKKHLNEAFPGLNIK